MEIGEAYLHYLPERPATLEALGLLAFGFGETAARERLARWGATVEVDVAEGSRKSWTTFIGVVGIELLLHYGDVRSSLDYLISDARWAATQVNEHVEGSLQLASPDIVREERRTKTPGKLQRLFAKVESGALEPRAATDSALELLQTTPAADRARLEPILLNEFTSVPVKKPIARPAKDQSHRRIPQFLLQRDAEARGPRIRVRRNRRTGIVEVIELGA